MTRRERLDFAERWLADGFRVIDPPGGILTVDVDMSGAARLVERLRAGGVRATFNHVVVRAAALALARRPELHLLVAGGRRLVPEQVDIGLSVAGETVFAPVMKLMDAGRKPLGELAAEIVRRIPEVRAEEARGLVALRRWGWLVPFGFLRRLLLGLLYRTLLWRRAVVGTFQVTCLPAVDQVAGLTFYSAGLLCVPGVRDRVVAVDGAAVVRPVLRLTCVLDHKVWDGVRGAAFLGEVRAILEQNQLDGEVPDMVAP